MGFLRLYWRVLLMLGADRRVALGLALAALAVITSPTFRVARPNVRLPRSSATITSAGSSRTIRPGCNSECGP